MRQFKFVGGPKRKRRRRDALSGELTEVLPNAAAAQPDRVSAASTWAKYQQSATISENQKQLVATEAAERLYITASTSDGCLSSVEHTVSPSIEESEVDHGSDCSVGGFFDLLSDALPSYEDTSGMINCNTMQCPVDFNTMVGLEGIAHPQFTTGGADQSEDSPADLLRLEAPSCSDSPPLSLPKVLNDYTVDRVLLRYDQGFCVLPLIDDFEANPLCWQAENVPESQMLFHCIQTLYYKYIQGDIGKCVAEAQNSEWAGFHMLDSIDRTGQALATTATLDILLILMTSKRATTALGPWIWYLKHVNKVLRAESDIRQDLRTQAQIEIFAWWDVNLALTSRKGYVLSQSTVQNLVEHNDTSRTSCYGVAGCPKFLFRHMIQLVMYAKESELITSMTCVRIDLGPILAIEKELINWEPVKDVFTSELAMTGEEAESIAQVEEDLRHYVEAWRHGLLIYIERVLKWNRKEEISPMVQFLARKTLDHVRCCRRESTMQKRLLLPLFLAGCEVKDKWLRKESIEYCEWWEKKTGCDMFPTASNLMQIVWDDEKDFEWWGPVIDQHDHTNSDGTMGRQYLFV